MLSNHLILCHPLLLLPSIFPNIRVFSNESALLIRWPKYWSFSFGISPSNNIQGWFSLGLTDLISLQPKRLSRVFSSATVWKHQFFGTQPSLRPNSHICTWLLEKPELWLHGPLSAKWLFIAISNLAFQLILCFYFVPFLFVVWWLLLCLCSPLFWFFWIYCMFLIYGCPVFQVC